MAMASFRGGWSLGTGLMAGMLSCGCVAQHGKDFGHWMGRAGYVPLIRISTVEDKKAMTEDDTILMLPLLGVMDQNAATAFKQDLLREAQRFLRPRVVALEPDERLAKYVTAENLSPVPGIIDCEEVARVGQLLDASYVVCVWVSGEKTYPPQAIAAHFVVVKSATGRMMGEMDAHFNAEEQRVVVALGEYLQSRRAREYDRTSLDIMLRSPTEYRAFVASQCVRAMAQEICQ